MKTSTFAIFAVSAMAMAVSFAGAAATEKWERPKTTRRYVQGPLAERVVVCWREGKVTIGEVRHFHDWKKTIYNAVGATPNAFGVWLLHGGADEPFAFADAVMHTEQDATPIHGQHWQLDGLKVELETCAPFGRRPSANLRVKVTNTGDRSLRHRFALMLRSGEERQLVFSAPDLYAVYDPRLSQWLGLGPTWRRVSEQIWKDGDRFLTASVPAAWDGAKGVLRFTAEVSAGASRVFDFTLGEGAVEMPDYEARRDRTRSDWQKELARTKDRSRMIRFLTVHMLQCFSRASGRDYALPRQGCLQRWVWPGDQKQVSAALGLLGYGEYVEMAVDFYVSEYSKEDGEFGPFGNGWANDTASVLEIFSRYCLDTDNAAYWRRYRDRMARAFGWIAAKRRESIGRAGCVEGLFPPMKATDEAAVFQAWGNTDSANLLAMEYFAKAAEKFGDTGAAEFRGEAKAYRAVMTGILDGWRERYRGSDIFHIPLDPKGVLEPELRRKNYFYCHPSRFLALDMLSEDEAVRLRRWLIREGIADGCGLYQRNPTPICWDTMLPTPREIADNVWYTTASELYWYLSWKKWGREDLARQTLDAAIRYGMSEEMCVGERFCSANPWYFPWSPNGSGAGRLVQMLLAR